MANLQGNIAGQICSANTEGNIATILNITELNLTKPYISPTHSKESSEWIVENCEGCLWLAQMKPNQHSAICAMKRGRYPFARDTDYACKNVVKKPIVKGTLAPYLRPLMFVRSVKTSRCAICGRAYPLEQHHIVRRSAGELYVGARRLDKPTITLCGFGNNLRDADGNLYCHGLAHHQRLHFRANEKRLEYLITDEPIKTLKAYEMDGWKPVRGF